MRVMIILLSISALCVLFTGCSTSGGNFRGSQVITTVTSISGAPMAGTQVTLTQNGTTVATARQTDTTGNVAFSDISSNSGFVLEITSTTGAFPPTFFGPFQTSEDRNFTIPFLTFTELANNFNIPRPTDGSATLVVFGMSDFSSTATTIPVEVRIDFGPIQGPGSPEVIKEIAAGTHTVTVINPATSQTVVFSDVPFIANSIVVIRTALNEVPENLTFSGTIRNAVTDATVSGADLTLAVNGVPVATAITNSSGAFSIHNLTPSTGFSLVATSSTNQFVRTIFAPLTIAENISNAQFSVFTQQQLIFEFPGVPTPPDNSTATLVVLAFDQNDNVIGLTYTVNSFTPVTGLPPAATVPAGTYTITVTEPVFGQSITLTNVTLVGGAITVLKIPDGIF